VPADLRVEGLVKSFTLHLQGGAAIPVLAGLDFAAAPGKCLVLAGLSGRGKSTVLRLVWGSYRAQAGRILVRHGGGVVDIAAAPPRLVLEVRRRTMGYVSQFLRVLPRVPALDVVAEPLVARGLPPAETRARAAEALDRLRIPERLWPLPPATFSGGEQQRVNLARGLAPGYPLLLLDEPTASLDAANRAAVVELILAAKARGAALLAICHDPEVGAAVATRTLDLPAGREAA
jgi:alpha-D-ribose 1-methylphosphonate 5-triphosphate synthase subunit PhnL